jgi:hypothetical protein
LSKTPNSRRGLRKGAATATKWFIAVGGLLFLETLLLDTKLLEMPEAPFHLASAGVLNALILGLILDGRRIGEALALLALGVVLGWGWAGLAGVTPVGARVLLGAGWPVLLGLGLWRVLVAAGRDAAERGGAR